MLVARSVALSCLSVASIDLWISPVFLASSAIQFILLTQLRSLIHFTPEKGRLLGSSWRERTEGEGARSEAAEAERESGSEGVNNVGAGDARTDLCPWSDR